MTQTSRRHLLQTLVGVPSLVTLCPSLPRFLLDTSASAAQKKGDNVLVVVQLSGGNDGLNTVVPYAHDGYQRNRVQLRVEASQVLKVSDELGLHPSLSGLHALYEQGQLAILQGVGYPNPNRSHFESMDIWHTAEQVVAAGGRRTGWVGRYLDASAIEGQDIPAIHIGLGRQPLALAGTQVRAASVQSLEAFRVDYGGDAALRRTVKKTAEQPRSRNGELLQFLQRSTVSALASSDRVQEALKNYNSPVAYPAFPLAQQLKNVAQLIEAGLSTRVYYLSHDGFDTHANQAAAHAGLLQQLGDALAAFMKDLQHLGQADRVTVMTFSEFGRRVKENASAGTDHGAAAPMFMMGPRVRAGVIGEHPSLADLDEGDLKHHTDFRRVYATVLRQWLGLDPSLVLEGRYTPLDLLRA